jgi:hypothetical protein
VLDGHGLAGKVGLAVRAFERVDLVQRITEQLVAVDRELELELKLLVPGLPFLEGNDRRHIRIDAPSGSTGASSASRSQARALASRCPGHLALASQRPHLVSDFRARVGEIGATQLERLDGNLALRREGQHSAVVHEIQMLVRFVDERIRLSLSADKSYDTKNFVADLRDLNSPMWRGTRQIAPPPSIAARRGMLAMPSANHDRVMLLFARGKCVRARESSESRS